MLLPTAFQLADTARLSSAAPHPLTGTAAEWMWALPLLPLLGFVLNGALSVIGAARIGPADPTIAGHEHGHGESADHSDAHGAAPARHRFAGAGR